MEYDAFKNKLFIQAAEYGFSDYELYYAASNSFTVRIFMGEISEYKNTDAVGLSFRGTFEGRVGYAFTEKMDDELIPALLFNAAGNAGIIEEKEIEKLYPGDETYPEVNAYNPALNETSAADKIDKALAMEKYALKLDSRVKSVDYCILSSYEAAVRIANSYGMDLSHSSNLAHAFMYVRVEENGVTKMGGEFWCGNDFKDFSHEKLAKEAADKALSYLGAASIPSGHYPVVFDNYSAGDLFAAFSGVFYAENAQKGFSLLGGKVNENIAASHVTIKDDGVCEKSFGSVPFDSEGVAAQNKAVIENGVLKTLLYNTKAAEKDGLKSTGNGFKPSFRGAVGTSCTNFYLLPSDISFDDVIAPIENGVLITELDGLHSGTNAVSGDFSLSADGFLIENGKIGKPVEQITVAGNFYDLLKNIKTIGGDLRFHIPSGSGSIGSPSFHAEGLRISGL